MIRLKRLTLRNWCQYQHAEVEFGTVTALLGPIGAGKTNLLHAICFALTGESRAKGVKSSNVRQGAESGDVSDVVLEFRSGGSDCEIRRSAKTSSVKLKVGDTTYTSSASVDKAMSSILKVEPSLLTDYVFVDQWQMFSFLLSKDADRVRDFAKIFGIERAESLYTMVAKHQVPQPLCTVDVDAVRYSLQVAETARAGLEENIAAARGRLLSEQNLHLAKTVVEQRPLLLHWRSAVQAGEARLKVIDDQINAVQANIQVASSAYSALAIQSDKYTKKRESIARAEEAMRAYQSSAAVFALAETRVKNAVEALNAVVAEGPPDSTGIPTAEEAASSQDFLLATRERLSVVRHLLREAKERQAKLKGLTTCPTCGSSVVGDPALMLKALEGERDELTLKESSFAQTVSRRSDYVQAGVAFAAKHEKVCSVLAHAQDALKLLGERPVNPEVDPSMKEDAVKVSRFFEELRLSLAAVHGLESELPGLDLTRKMVREQVDAAELQLRDMLPSTEEVFLQSKRILEEDARLRSSLALDLDRLESLKIAISRDRELLARAVEEAAKLESWKSVVSRLDKLKMAFHRDGAPALFAREALTSMVDGINSDLEASDAGFLLSGVEGLDSKHPLTFNVAFPGGVQVPASRLSGGQKVLLALGFRFTLQREFADDLGLLCLDEPTAGLNATNIDDVGRLLYRIRSDSEARGTQIVLVTHEPSLARFCDRIIRIGKKGQIDG